MISRKWVRKVFFELCGAARLTMHQQEFERVMRGYLYVSAQHLGYHLRKHFSDPKSAKIPPEISSVGLAVYFKDGPCKSGTEIDLAGSPTIKPIKQP